MIINFKYIYKVKQVVLYRSKTVDYNNLFPRFNVDSLLKHDKEGHIN